MAEVYKFFNSAPGDEREYYASDFANYFSSVLSAGLLLDENEEYGLQVTLDSGLNVKVAIGKALIKGYSYANTTDLTLTHTLPETEYDRIDRIVLRLDLRNANRYIRAFVKIGVASANPVAPDLQRDQYIYELSLAQVRLRANTASIEASDIIDERALEDLCGIVQSLITVPISVFQQQFDAWFNNQKTVYETEIVNWQNQEKADFEAWVESLHNILDGDVAANLASRITTLEQEFTSHQADDTIHVKKDGTLQTGLNAEKINGKTATAIPSTTEKNDIIGMVNEVFQSGNNVKTNTVNALLSKDSTLPITNNSPWNDVISAIGSLSNGAKTYSSTATSSTGTKSFTYVGGSSVTINYLSVSGLPFKPRYIIAYSGSVTILYSEVRNNLYAGPYVAYFETSSSGNTSSSNYTYKGDVSSVSITSSSFIIPVGSRGGYIFEYTIIG